jgi:hypothetical protein
MIQTAIKLVTEKLILSSLHVKTGKVLSPATAETVKQFKVSNKISRIILECETLLFQVQNRVI